MNSFTGLKYMRSAIKGLTFLAALSFAAPAFAANTVTSTTKTKTPPVPKAPESPWSFVFNLETASNLMKEGTYEHSALTSLQASATYKFNKMTSINATAVVVREHTEQENTNFDNSSIGLKFTSPVSKNVDWYNSINGILPTNHYAQDQSSFQGSASYISGLSFKNLIWDSSGTTGVSLSRNFHEYDMSADGVYNVRNTGSLILSYSLPLLGELALDTMFKYTEAWLYNDDTRGKFFFSAELTWAFTPKFAVYVGTSNEGSALKPNGVDSNIQVFDETTSVICAGINLRI